MLALGDVTHLGCRTRLSEAWVSLKDESLGVPAEGLWGDSDRASGGRIPGPRAILPRCHERAAGPHGLWRPQLPHSHAVAGPHAAPPAAPRRGGGAQQTCPTGVRLRMLASPCLHAAGVCARMPRPSRQGCSRALVPAPHAECHAVGWLRSPKDG